MREPDGLFNADTAPRMAEDTTVRQGFLEEANVSAVRELGRMMIGFRAYEASATALRLNDQTLSMLIENAV